MYHKWPGICSIVVIIFLSFPRSWHIVKFVTRVTRQVSSVKQETAGVHSWFLLGLCCHTLVAGAIFCRSLSLLFGHCIVYPFWQLYCLSFFDLWLLIKLLVLSNFSLCLCVNWCISMSTGKFCINMIHLYTQWVSCRRCWH